MCKIFNPLTVQRSQELVNSGVCGGKEMLWMKNDAERKQVVFLPIHLDCGTSVDESRTQ